MKPYPLVDSEYALSGERLHFEMLLTAAGDFGLSVYSLDEHSKLHIEIDNKPIAVRELKIGFFESDSQDFLKTLRALLELADSGSN